MSYNINEYSDLEESKSYLRCPNEECSHTWMYNGKSRFYASCPFCRKNVHVIKNKVNSPRKSRD